MATKTTPTAAAKAAAARTAAAKAKKAAAKAKKAAAKAKAAKAAAAKAAKQAAKKTHREQIVEWAHWFQKHGQHMPYTMTPLRAGWLHQQIGHYPIDTDCSGFATLCYAWAGCHDPNGLNQGAFTKPGAWTELGATGSLLSHAYEHGEVFTDLSKALPGDLLVYGPGTGEHVVVIIETGHDPLTVSHGSEGVYYVRPSQDGRMPQRICRYIKATK